MINMQTEIWYHVCNHMLQLKKDSRRKVYARHIQEYVFSDTVEIKGDSIRVGAYKSIWNILFGAKRTIITRDMFSGFDLFFEHIEMTDELKQDLCKTFAEKYLLTYMYIVDDYHDTDDYWVRGR